MIVNSHGYAPTPIMFDDDDPILEALTSYRLYWNQQRRTVVASLSCRIRDGRDLARLMLGLPKNSKWKIRYRDGNACNLQRSNLELVVINRTGKAISQLQKPNDPPPSRRLRLARHIVDPIVPDARIQEYVRDQILTAMTPDELTAWMEAHR